MKRAITILLLLAAAPLSHAGILARGKVLLICHRTANQDMPENTLESLDLAARMGCNIVEVDLRRTLDGKIVLNHDGVLERLTNGMGWAETTYSDELSLLDAGSWMGDRFAGMRVPQFDDALRLARERGIGLFLDFKDKGMAPEVLQILAQEGMLERVRFGGESDDVKALYPDANQDPIAGVEPGVTAAEVAKLHAQGKTVIANFSANQHERDLPGMRAAVAAGVDALNVDFPRLGADALGRPVEAKISVLVGKAESGPATGRAAAILELAHYDGFPLQAVFERALRQSDDRISRAAAIALLTARPYAPTSSLVQALTGKEAVARKNAAWVIGMRGAPEVPALLPLLKDPDPGVLQEALLAISRCPGDVAAEQLLPFLSNGNPSIRGAAAVALARHHPGTAGPAIRKELTREEALTAKDYAAYVQRGKSPYSQSEIDALVAGYQGLMKIMQSVSYLDASDARSFYEDEAFRSVPDTSLTTALIAVPQLWNRVAADPARTIQALGSSSGEIGDRAESILIQAGPGVLPAVRQALASPNSAIRERAIRIVAWQGDRASLPALRAMKDSHTEDPELLEWAIEKIGSMAFAIP
jgi:glycerophosphoryl diester phosphodiesterase